MTDNSASILDQVNLASKNDITDFVKNKDFDEKLKITIKKINSNETKRALIQYDISKQSK